MHCHKHWLLLGPLAHISEPVEDFISLCNTNMHLFQGNFRKGN